MGYLDYVGLQYLWGKLKEKFAPKSHDHDDRYYTEAEVNSKLGGKADNTEAGANGLINKLDSGTAAPVDDDLIITQWANHTTATAANQNKYVRRPMSSIWSYIKGKADSVYQPKGSYAANGHTHDDRYYTESEMNTKLSKKAENIVLASDTNLNNITTPGFYSCGGGNKITNKPNNTDAIGLIVTHNASGNYYTQILTTSSNANTYRRTCLNGTWSGWTQDKYTDTNTWRGIQNNLTSDSTSDSLSAAQGKALKELVDGKANSLHTHTKSQITDFPTSLKNPTALTIQTNGTTAATYDGSAAKTVNVTKGNIGLGNVDNTADANKSVKYATSAGSASTATKATTADKANSVDWSKVQNKPSSYPPASHSHSYLPLGGGTMSGQIIKSTGGTWIGDRDRAAIRSSAPGDSNYGAVAAMGTKNGCWTMGNLSGNESLIFNYSTDTNYNAGKNETSQVCLPAQAGTIITSATIGSQTVKYANSAGTATNATNATNATTATKLSSSAGSNTQPVYFSGGKPVVIGYTIAKSVPSDAKFTDTTYGVATTSSNGLMSSTDKTKLDDFSKVISIQKKIKMTTDWQDTGIAGTSLDTGTYVIQVSVVSQSYAGLYGEIYSGVMTWYANETNSDNSSEIFLHNTGHAYNSNAIYLRTSRRGRGNGDLHLQIACKVVDTNAVNLTFKFRRLI